MNKRRKAAAVLSLLAVGIGAVVITDAYEHAAVDTASTVPEVAAESQEEAIEAAALLRQMGHTPAEAADSIAAHTRAPVDAVRALVADRRAAAARDPRQRNGRVGVLATSANVAAVETAIRDTMCEPLVDPRASVDAGPTNHPMLDECFALWRDALGTRYCIGPIEVGRGAQWSALPSQRRDLATATQQAGGVYVEDPDDVSEAYAAEVSNQGWGPCPSALH